MSDQSSSLTPSCAPTASATTIPRCGASPSTRSMRSRRCARHRSIASAMPKASRASLRALDAAVTYPVARMLRASSAASASRAPKFALPCGALQPHCQRPALAGLQARAAAARHRRPPATTTARRAESHAIAHRSIRLRRESACRPAPIDGRPRTNPATSMLRPSYAIGSCVLQDALRHATRRRRNRKRMRRPESATQRHATTASKPRKTRAHSTAQPIHPGNAACCCKHQTPSAKPSRTPRTRAPHKVRGERIHTG